MRWWPLFDLAVRTPRLELRYADDELLLALGDLMTDDVLGGGSPFDGDSSFYVDPPERQRRSLLRSWELRGRTSPDFWVLQLVVLVDGEVAGIQAVTGIEFPAVRTAETASWIAADRQRQGLGREARAAALQLAFEGLGALRAVSEAFEDNVASRRVSESLGYEPNGTAWYTRRGEAAPMQRYVLPRERWLRRDDVELVGVTEARELLGL